MRWDSIDMEDDHRASWKTILLGEYLTYDAFSIFESMTGGDAAIYSKHVETINSSTELKLHQIRPMWEDVFVAPAFDDILDPRYYKIRRLIYSIMIPHIHTVLLPLGGRRLANRMDIFARALGDFDIGYANAGQFWMAVQELSRAPCGGQGIVRKLAGKGAREEFERLLPQGFLSEDDYILYRADRSTSSGSCEEKLILPSWVRNRLAHPENCYVKEFPSRHDIKRATGMVYAASLALLYRTMQSNRRQS